MFDHHTATLFITHHLDTILPIICIVLIILCLAFIIVLSKVAQLIRLYHRLTRGTSGGNLEEILHEFMTIVYNDSNRMDKLEEKIVQTDQELHNCVQHIGVVRFDAFEDIGGEQSYAVAMMDDRKNGVVFSSVYSRNSIRVYAKAMVNGQPSHKLSEEEERALAKASGK